MASSRPATDMIGSTGPNVSSRITRIPWSTPVEHRRRVEPAVAVRAGAARAHDRAARDRVRDVVLHDRPLALQRERAHVGVGARGVAHAQGARARDHLLGEGVGDGRVHVDALDRRAGLARVHERAPDDAVGRLVEVGVGADDRRVLAAQLEHHRRQVRAAAAMMRLPVATLPVKTILPTRAVLDEQRRPPRRPSRRRSARPAAGRRGGRGRPPPARRGSSPAPASARPCCRRRARSRRR